MISQSILFAFTAVSASAAVVSTGVAVFTVFRDGRRLKSSEAKQLEKRLDDAERWSESDEGRALSARVDLALRWHDSTEAKVIITQIDRNSANIAACLQRLENVATKTELAHVEGSISRVESIVRGVEAGVDRIESMLMKKALDV